jgi:PAS domain S-box-containing protein
MVNRRLITELERDIAERELLEASLQHRNDILAASHQVMLDLMNQRNGEDVLETLLAKIGVLLDVSDVSVDLIEHNDTLVTYAATPGQPLTKGDTMRRGEGGWLSWQAVDTEQPAILEDYSAWSQRRELYVGFPIHAIAIIPIYHHEHVIGTINFSRREANKPFTDTDIYVSEQLAQVVALVLDNAQLYAQLQSELAERKRIEEDLRESQENFQRYFNMSTVGMCVTSPDRHWIEANGRLCQMLGYSDEELANLTWSQITHPDDLDPDLTLYNQILSNERDSYQLDKRFIRKDGSILYTTLFVACHRDPDGTVRYLLSSVVDITDRRQSEDLSLKLAAVEERQRLARDLHDSVNQSIHGLVLFSETLVSTLQKNNTERAREIANRLQESARQALKETRLMLYQMQAAGLERSVDLLVDLEARLATVERRAGVRAQIHLEGPITDCPRAWHENLFWITIEALNNALKHAQARNMKINLRCSSEQLELEIVDDGIGFDPDGPRAGGLGLQTMRDRASLIGGGLTIISTPQMGSCIRFNAEIKE